VAAGINAFTNGKIEETFNRTMSLCTITRTTNYMSKACTQNQLVLPEAGL
jgi:hypothetical protein